MMKKTKMILSVFLSLILLAGIAGCGAKSDANVQTEPLSIQLSDATETPGDIQKPEQPSVTVETALPMETEISTPLGSSPESPNSVEASTTNTPSSAAVPMQTTGNVNRELQDSITPGVMPTVVIPTAAPTGEPVTLTGEFVSEGGKYYLQTSSGKFELIADEEMLLSPDGTMLYEGKTLVLSGNYSDASRKAIIISSLLPQASQTEEAGGGTGSSPAVCSQTTSETLTGTATKMSDGGYQLKKEGTSQDIALIIDAVLLEAPGGVTINLDGKKVHLAGCMSGDKFTVYRIESVE